MEKIKSLFKRDYDGTRQVFDEIVPGSEWVERGEGVATLKIDGTSCLVRNGELYKRYDRKLNDAAARRKKQGFTGPWELTDYKLAPEGWEAAEAQPDPNTGHWPGWLPVGDGPDDQWHREAFQAALQEAALVEGAVEDGTYELVGPKVQGNLYHLERHQLWRHGLQTVEAPRSFAELKAWFQEHVLEGIVWHHPDGRMVKIKRRDFGLPWPEK